MFGDPDRSSAVLPQQGRTEGGVWRRRQPCVLSGHRAERTAGGPSHTDTRTYVQPAHTPVTNPAASFMV